MARQYGSLIRPNGIFIPRWVLAGLGILLLVYLGFSIFLPPVRTVQLLESPDGERKARLKRISYTKDHFVVQAKSGMRWSTLHVTAPMTNQPSVDLLERIAWSDNSRYLALRYGTNWVWTYDFTRQTSQAPAALPEETLPQGSEIFR